jgi:superfamily I DNA/RNA helicase
MRAQAVEYPLDFFGFKDWSDVEEASKLEGGAELQRWVRLFEKHEPTNLRGILERLPKNERDADIILSTGHKSKGREWDAVRLCDGFLPGVQSEAEERAKGALPMNGEADYAAELRLFYVAATRGKVKLEIPPVLNARLEKLAKLAAKSQRKPELVS